ncbi:uncharacterized protein LOC118432744 [Branchiostoma floridae]|uniref:Uncharacterized protein LOC118432744 n=1 Tax=Branchiostoma floridae TaxID=7739 RepID=A0A9J7NBK6_BRAFL|nr:uncharacterized protein LOC118432744 [Branchiostoma floridae]XP_035700248.1 uncharacterized protein LOC118432744 [Branchiostoma floridae]
MRNVLLVVAFMMFYIGYRQRGNDMRRDYPSGKTGNGNDEVQTTVASRENAHRGKRGILVLNKTPGIEVRFSSKAVTESQKRIISQNAKVDTKKRTLAQPQTVKDTPNRTRNLKAASQPENTSVENNKISQNADSDLLGRRQVQRTPGKPSINNNVESQPYQKDIRESTKGPPRLQGNETIRQNTTYKTSAKDAKDMASVNGNYIPQTDAFGINNTFFAGFDMEDIDVNLTRISTDGNWSLDGEIATDVDFDYFMRKEHNQSLGALIENVAIVENHTLVTDSLSNDSQDFQNSSKPTKEDCEDALEYEIEKHKRTESGILNIGNHINEGQSEDDQFQLSRKSPETLQQEGSSSEDKMGTEKLLQSLLTLLQRESNVLETTSSSADEYDPNEDENDISSNIYMDYQNDDDEFKVDTEYDFSDHDDIEQSDGIRRVIKLDRYAHVVSCQINVACNLGRPNRRCKCRPNNRQRPGVGSTTSCVFPKARVTHRSLTKKGLLSSFCFGVSLPALGRRYKYDMRTKCSFYGRPNVTYKVYVSKAVKGSAKSKKGRTVRYKACLRPVQ